MSMVSLSRLHPKFFNDHGTDTDDYDQAVGISFDCPGCAWTPHMHRIFAPFQGRYQGPGAAWAASGTGYEDLTFSDSPQGTRSIRVLSGCCSHFNVTAGVIDFYGDSGHLQPRQPMTETKDPVPATEEPSGATEAPPAATITAAAPPTGYFKTEFLQFLNGILHQRHDNPHINDDDPHVWVPVAGTSIPPGLVGTLDEMLKEHSVTIENRLAEFEKRFEARLAALKPPAGGVEPS